MRPAHAPLAESEYLITAIICDTGLVSTFRQNPDVKGYEMTAPYTEWVSLGGNNEDDIGGNCHLVTYFDGRHAMSILIDHGNKFSKVPGYDQFFPIVPKGLKATFSTHGHLDHIGATAHLLNYGLLVPPAVYGSAMSNNVLRIQLGRVYGNEKPWPHLHDMEPRKAVNVGHIRVTGVSVSHSIPQAMGFYVETPTARLFFTGDCKWDQELPIKPTTDAETLERIGERGLDAAYIDSTRCQMDGFTRSEQEVRDEIRAQVLANPQVEEFIMPIMSTSVQRMAVLAELSQELQVPVVYEGRSIEDILEAGKRSGIDLKKMYPGARIFNARSLTGQEIVQRGIRHFHMGTGTQGEENAFFSKAMRGENQNVKLDSAKTLVLFLSSVIPGNEAVCDVNFAKLREMGIRYVMIHTSGHGSAGDLLKYGEVLNPRTLFPVHGSRAHIEHHAKIQQEAGRKVQVAMNGDKWRWNARGEAPYYAGHIDTKALACKEAGQEWVKDSRSKTGREFLRNIYEYAIVDSWDAPKTESGITLQKPKKILVPGMTPAGPK